MGRDAQTAGKYSGSRPDLLGSIYDSLFVGLDDSHFDMSNTAYPPGFADPEQVLHLPHSAVEELASLLIGNESNESCVSGHDPWRTPAGVFTREASPEGPSHLGLATAAILACHAMYAMYASQQGRKPGARSAHTDASDGGKPHRRLPHAPKDPTGSAEDRVARIEETLRTIIKAGKLTPHARLLELPNLFRAESELTRALNELRSSPEGQVLGLGNIAKHIENSARRILERT
ncbi:MAG: hypothetical protein AAF550_06045, partial [Myxococcota bacterium]